MNISQWEFALGDGRFSVETLLQPKKVHVFENRFSVLDSQDKGQHYKRLIFGGKNHVFNQKSQISGIFKKSIFDLKDETFPIIKIVLQTKRVALVATSHNGSFRGIFMIV